LRWAAVSSHLPLHLATASKNAPTLAASGWLADAAQALRTGVGAAVLSWSLVDRVTRPCPEWPVTGVTPTVCQG